MAANGAAFGLNYPEPLNEFPPDFYEAHPHALPPTEVVGLPVARTDLVQMLGNTSLAGERGLIDAVRAAKLNEIVQMDDEIAARVTEKVRNVLAVIGEGLPTDEEGFLTGESYIALGSAVGLTPSPEVLDRLRDPDFFADEFLLADGLESMAAMWADDVATDEAACDADADTAEGSVDADSATRTAAQASVLITTGEVITVALRNLDLADFVDGRLVLTAAARVCAKDPFRLAHQIASHLPISLNEFEHEASLLVLLDMARSPRLTDLQAELDAPWDALPDEPDDAAVAEVLHFREATMGKLMAAKLERLSEMMEGLDWEFDEDSPVSAEDVLEAATPTLASLETLGLTGQTALGDEDLLEVSVTDDFRSFLAYTLRGGPGFIEPGPRF